MTGRLVRRGDHPIPRYRTGVMMSLVFFVQFNYLYTNMFCGNWTILVQLW